MMCQTGILLVAVYLLGVTYVRGNLFKPLRRRSGVALSNVNLHALELAAMVCGGMGVILLFNFCSWEKACLVALVAGVYDWGLRVSFFYREVARLRSRQPSLTRDVARRRVKRRAQLTAA